VSAIERGHETKVLDHGYVRFIDAMGSDEAIVEAARMSTGRGFVSWESYRRCKRCDHVGGLGHAELMFCSGLDKAERHDWQDFPRGDLGLLTSLYANKHLTPFECGGELMVEVQAPIFVFREWHRHRTQSYNEFSARYAQMPDLHYLPEVARIQKQSTTNKQGSGEAMGPETAMTVVEGFRGQQSNIYRHYDHLVGVGVAKEVARINTPVSRYSKMRAKTDLRNWLGFLMLRKAAGAQWEIRQYADAVGEIVRALWPRTYALFEEHDLHAVHLSRAEADGLRHLLREGDISTDEPALSALKTIAKKLGVA
jgi:thymidylate synthase (FAD)